MKKTLAERGAASACLHKVVAALRKIISGREEKNEKAVDMLTKLGMLYKQARTKVAILRVVEMSEF